MNTDTKVITSMPTCALNEWGWNEYFEAWHQSWMEEWNDSTLKPARVVAEQRGSVLLRFEDHEARGEMSGKLRHSAEASVAHPATVRPAYISVLRTTRAPRQRRTPAPITPPSS